MERQGVRGDREERKGGREGAEERVKRERERGRGREGEGEE